MTDPAADATVHAQLERKEPPITSDAIRTDAELAALDPALGLPHRRKMQILFAIMLGLFLSALDQTIVGTALPRIVGDLNGTNELYTWVITSYLLAATITGVFYGKLSDIFGRRLMLLIGITIFLAGSALSGLSWNMESLILFRGLQGIGAGAIFPISLAVIGDLFTPRERGRYQGLFGAVFGVASIIGPLLGGWLTDNLSWHWIFYVNLPIGAVALFIIFRFLPSVHGERPTRQLDYLGAIVFAVGVVFLLLGLTNKQTAPWESFEVGGFLIIAALLTPLFLFIEARAAEPIVPLDLFRNRSYAVTILATFLAAIGFFGAIIFLPRWFQFVKGVSPTDSGLQTMALLAGVILSSVLSGYLVSRSGRYKWIVTGSLAVMAVGILLLTGLTAKTELPVLWLWMFIAGMGIGPTLSVFTIVVQSVVPFERLGVATGNLTFFRQIGGSVGLAVVGTLFAESFTSRLGPSLAASGVPAEQVGALTQLTASGSDLTQVGGEGLRAQLAQVPALNGFVDQIVTGIHQAFSLAVADTFWFGLATTLIALGVVAVGLKEVQLRGMAPGSAAAEPETPVRAAGRRADRPVEVPVHVND
jgi:EmrB/QacA subfamily drug resistance transporter